MSEFLPGSLFLKGFSLVRSFSFFMGPLKLSMDLTVENGLDRPAPCKTFVFIKGLKWRIPKS
jgi:hypothetical protein